MLCHAFGGPVIFISLLTYVAPVLFKIPVFPPDVCMKLAKNSFLVANENMGLCLFILLSANSAWSCKMSV